MAGPGVLAVPLTGTVTAMAVPGAETWDLSCNGKRHLTWGTEELLGDLVI